MTRAAVAFPLAALIAASTCAAKALDAEGADAYRVDVSATARYPRGNGRRDGGLAREVREQGRADGGDGTQDNGLCDDVFHAADLLALS